MFFFEDFKIFRTLAFLCFLSVSVCVHTYTRQVEHQRCSRTGRVQKKHKILRKNTIFNEHTVVYSLSIVYTLNILLSAWGLRSFFYLDACMQYALSANYNLPNISALHFSAHGSSFFLTVKDSLCLYVPSIIEKRTSIGAPTIGEWKCNWPPF